MRPADRLSEAGLIIYLLHGVIEPCRYVVRNYTRKHVDKDWFYKEMCELSRRGRPLSMDEVLMHHRAGSAYPPRSFAVTFDDGFENNASIAAPILQDLSIPATFYVTTAFVDQQSMSWIDRLEYCLEHCPPGVLRLPGMDALRFNGPAERIAVLDHLRRTLKPDARADLEAVVAMVFAQCGMPPIECSDDPLDRKLSWSQVRQLAATPGFIVGGHSHRHAVLSFLDPPALRDDVDTSMMLLRRHLPDAPIHYSYPEGQTYSYSAAVIDLLQSHGVQCCPTAVDGVNTVEVDLFRLHRTAIDDRPAGS